MIFCSSFSSESISSTNREGSGNLKEYFNDFYRKFDLLESGIDEIKKHQFCPLLNDMIKTVYLMDYSRCFDFENFFLPSSTNKIMNSYKIAKKLDLGEELFHNYKLNALMYSMVDKVHHELSLRISSNQIKRDCKFSLASKMNVKPHESMSERLEHQQNNVIQTFQFLCHILKKVTQ